MKRDRDETVVGGAPQTIEIRGENDKIVRNSPYGPSRASLGWGTPFQPPASCTIKEFPQLRIGTSSLNSIRGKDRDMERMLKQYMKKFSVLEHCNPYHRMGDEEHWAQWKAYVSTRRDPPFVYTVKANQYLTHTRMLEVDDDTINHIDNFFAKRCSILGSQLWAVLIQLPPQFHMTIPHLERIRAVATRIAPTGVHCAIEFRHKSWYCEEVYAVLKDIRWTLVVTHNEDVGESPMVDTGTDLLYVRLHGAVERFCGDYGPAAMSRWAELIMRFLSGGPSRRVVFFLNNNESSANDLTSAVADGTFLANRIRELAKHPLPAAAASGPIATDLPVSTAAQNTAASPSTSQSVKQSPGSTSNTQAAAKSSPSKPIAVVEVID